MVNNFWTPAEVPMGSDLQDWKTDKLNEAEQHMFLTVFAQLTTFDLLRTSDIVQDFLPLVHAPEITQALTTQAFQECLHTHSYQTVIEVLGLPQDDIYQRYKNVPELANRVALTEQLGGLSTVSSPKEIFRALVHTYVILEGTWFLVNLLGPVQSLARRNLMKGTAQQFQYIARDEFSHTVIGIYLLRDFIKEHPEVMDEESIHAVIADTEQGLRLEEDFIHYALPRPVLGYNAADHISTARHYAALFLGRIGINHDFGGEHKYPWFDEMVATNKEAAFFEVRNTEYQVGSIQFEESGYNDDWGVKF
jgi:ribonucleoside-diphosphate reductase beta chain